MSRARDLANVADDVSTGTVVTTASPSLGRRNLIINGAMQVAQRGTSFSHNGAVSQYPADRYNVNIYNTGFTTPTGGTSAQVSLSQESIESGLDFTKALRITPASDSKLCYASQRVEDVTLFSNKTVTFSFYCRVGSGSININTSGTRFTQLFGSGGSTAVSTYEGSGQTITTTWQRFEVTITIPSVSGKTIGSGNCLQVSLLDGIDLSSLNGSWIEFTGVQLEVGSVATPFEHRSYGEELALCQRYYTFFGGISNGFPLIQSYTGTLDNRDFPISFPVRMRATPTGTKNGTWDVLNCGQPTVRFLSPDGFSFGAIPTNAAANFYAYPSSTDDTLTFSAEL